MSLDPQSQSFLEMGKASGAPPLEEMSLEAARDALKQTMLSLDAARQDVARRQEMAIPGPAGSVPIRIYHPNGMGGDKVPIIIFIHGGGWALGDLDAYENMARFFCMQTKSLVISVGYRLAPEHKFPVGLNDCYAALQWAEGAADALGGDARAITLMGDSSGGNIAAAICLRAAQEKGPAIGRQVLLYPLLALEGNPPYAARKTFGGGDYFISKSSIAWTVDLYLNGPEEAFLPLASPLAAKSLAGLPPALIVSAGFDPLRGDAEAYAKKLTQAGVRVEEKCFETTIHGFLSFPGALDVGGEGLRFVAAWLRDNG